MTLTNTLDIFHFHPGMMIPTKSHLTIPSLGRIESAGEDSQIFWDAIVSIGTIISAVVIESICW